MKKYILLMLIILTITFSNAQVEQFICATEDDDVPYLDGVFSGSNDPDYLYSMEPVVLNIYYWRVDAPDGSVHPNALTERRVLESIAFLNISFNPIGIYFKYRGMGNFSSPSVIQEIYHNELEECVELGYPDPDGYETLSRCQSGDLINFATYFGYVEENAINVYVPRKLTNYGGGAYGQVKLITHPNGLNTDIIRHELGHNFSLRHTWVDWYKPNNPELCEHVTRNVNDDKFNANFKGDDLVDTAAMPDFLREYCVLNDLPNSDCIGASSPHKYKYYDVDNCIYTGQNSPDFRTDCDGTLLDITPEDARNTMAYAPNQCRSLFSIDQGIQMREFIVEETDLQNVTTDIQSLYEPYAAEYYIEGPLPLEYPLFQPGFEYRFIECDCECPAPADWLEVFTYDTNTILSIINKDETDFSTITHPNHSAIWIKQAISGEEVFPQPRKCYDNWNRKPSGGSITKFNDDVFNANVTISPQDSTAINNQYLIQNLESGLYKIEKNYEDGAIQETVIYKGNN